MRAIFRVSVVVIYLLLFFVATPVLSQGTNIFRFRLPERGFIELKTPASWRAELGPAIGPFATIILTPRSGAAFEVCITPMWHTDKKAPPTADELQEDARKGAERIKPKVVEKEINILKLVGSYGSGYYYSVTDAAPKLGEFKFMTQGYVPVGLVTVFFTILTNDGQEMVVNDALSMFKGAAHAAATVETDEVMVNMPGERWKVRLRIPGDYTVIANLTERGSEKERLMLEKGAEPLVMARSFERDVLILGWAKEPDKGCAPMVSDVLATMVKKKIIDKSALKRAHHPRCVLDTYILGDRKFWSAMFTHDHRCIHLTISKTPGHWEEMEKALSIIDSLAMVE